MLLKLALLVLLNRPLQELRNLLLNRCLVDQAPRSKLVPKVLGHLVRRYTYSFHAFSILTSYSIVNNLQGLAGRRSIEASDILGWAHNGLGVELLVDR